MAKVTTGEDKNAPSADGVTSQKQYDFIGAVLAELGVPDTRGNRWFIIDWSKVENTKAQFNPLATSKDEPGATTFNSAGVKNYPDPATGAKATADTIRNYPHILAALQTGSPKVGGITAGITHDFGVWVSGPQGAGTAPWQSKAEQYTRSVWNQTESGDPYSGFGFGNFPIGKNNDPAQVAGRAANALKKDVLTGLGITGAARDLMYVLILLGGGAVLLIGFILIGADIGLTVFQQTKAAQKINIVTQNLPANRRAEKQYKERAYRNSREGISKKDDTRSIPGPNQRRLRKKKETPPDDIPF